MTKYYIMIVCVSIGLTLKFVVEIDKLSVVHLLKQIHHLLRFFGALGLIYQLHGLLKSLHHSISFQLACLLFRCHSLHCVDEGDAVSEC